MSEKEEDIWEAFDRVIAEYEAKHGPIDWPETSETKIERLERQLAESFAPCPACGGPLGLFVDCRQENRYSYGCLDDGCPRYCQCEHGKSLEETRAAWNAANRT